MDQNEFFNKFYCLFVYFTCLNTDWTIRSATTASSDLRIYAGVFNNYCVG